MREKQNINHPWWHWLFESWYRRVSYRDGFLGKLTPDKDIDYYKCLLPNCKWEKEKIKVLK